MRFSAFRKTGKNISGMNDWYDTVLGQRLLDELQEKLQSVMAVSFGYYALQLGCATQAPKILDSCRVRHHFYADSDGLGKFQTHKEMLAVASDSVDLVIIMHEISALKEPHAFLREVSRILIPQGKLIVIDFNPFSLWGLRHFFQSWLEIIPWHRHFFTARRLTDWMKLLGFERQRHLKVGYFLPSQRLAGLSWLNWIEKALKNWFGFAAALNVLVYDKNIASITPVRYRWMTRKFLAGKVARPSVGRDMKYDR
ncbi:MAG: SAM-dependent methyltransferase [Gammaproteobacteria bacterium]|jgi:SAM-dependent methyltransferase